LENGTEGGLRKLLPAGEKKAAVFEEGQENQNIV